ncbi:MAG: DUF4296 domain-containing protein [Bacteroidales bacterium]
MIKIRFLFLISLGLVLTACEQQVQKPDNLIPQDTLSYMLIDMHLIDGTVQVYNNHNKEKIALPKEYYDSVISNSYGYSDSVFQKSVEYYSVYGNIQEIYAQVLDSLNTYQAKLEQRRKHESKQKK